MAQRVLGYAARGHASKATAPGGASWQGSQKGGGATGEAESQGASTPEKGQGATERKAATKKKTPNQQEYRKIDLGIPEKAVEICKNNGISKVAVVSAIGANAKSSIAYNKIKGEMEHAVLSANIEHTYILRPSFIAGNRKEKRTGEELGVAVFKCFKFLIPKKYRAVEARDIAAKMIELCNSNAPSKIIESNDI